MRITKLFFATLSLSFLLSTTAFAGTWKMGAEPNQNKWWYDNDNGTFANNGWQWIDGNNDGIAECYYFDSNGWLLTNTTTPDGLRVNEEGAWVNNGVVETTADATQNNKTETNNSSEHCGYYEYNDNYGDGENDFNRIEVVACDENSVTLSEYGKPIIYNRAADNKYYPVSEDAYFIYVYFEGEHLITYAPVNYGYEPCTTYFTKYYPELNKSDFIVGGDNSVTRETADHSILTHNENLGYNTGYHTFVEGDSVITNRGISFPCTKDNVLNIYGITTIHPFVKAYDKVYEVKSSTTDGERLLEAVSYVEYSDFKGNEIIFYFDDNDKLLLIAYGAWWY